MNSDKDKVLSARSTYLITFLLGFSFTVTLVQSTWKTAIERKQKDFHFEILSIQQSVANNVLTGNDVTNNVSAFISSNDIITSSQYNSFANDILERYSHVDAINYFEFTGDDWINEFRLAHQSARGNNYFNFGEDIYSNTKYLDAIDTSIDTGAVVPAPPVVERGSDRKYWLFKAIYAQDDISSIKKKRYAGIVKGMVSVLVSPTKLLGDKATNSSLTITMFSDTANLYGRQLLYFNDPNNIDQDKAWRVETLREEKLINLPPYSIKIIIEKDLFFSDMEHHLLLVSLLISIGILMMLYGLVRARIKQEEELRSRNAVIEQKVEEQTQQLEIARDEALEAVRMKSEFLASMSHEIRTPLNAIIGMSDLMSETKLDEEQIRYVGVFKKAGDALLSLVNDILDLSKIEANQLSLENIQLNLTELIEEVAEIYVLKASDKNVEIITDIDPHINVNRIGDPLRLKQIILNLISNALKFTDEGEIIISLAANEDQDDDNHLLITVSDTGIGIPQNKLETIFASFSQADSSTTRKYGGTGLGLTISKRLIELMDGQIWVESEVGKGSRFNISLPMLEQADKTSIEKVFDNQSFIIMDQSLSNCKAICKELKAFGANCSIISEIEESESALSDCKNINVAIVDSRVFFSDDVINRLYPQYMQSAHLILMVNPKDMADHAKLARTHGLNKLLLKPIKRFELHDTIRATISPEQHAKKIYEESIHRVSSFAKKNILLVEDNPDNRMLIKAYLKKTLHSIDEAENGEIAVEMFKQNKYDLVLMDVQMPVMDGHEATRQIRSWEVEHEKERTVIISLTAHAIKEEIDKCMDAGCDAHLSKPVKKNVLLQTIDDY